MNNATQGFSDSDIRGCYNLLGAVIDLAVGDYNSGDPKRVPSAASFFSEGAVWMCDLVGASVSDIIKNRLNHDGDIIPPIRKKASSKLITWKGKTLSAADWSVIIGVHEVTFRARLNKFGLCEKSFASSRVKKPTNKIKFNGKALSLNEWSALIGITSSALRYRIKKYGVCAKVFNAKITPSGSEKKTGRAPEMITWDGKTMSKKGWAKHLGITENYMHNRFKKHGLQKKSFAMAIR